MKVQKNFKILLTTYHGKSWNFVWKLKKSYGILGWGICDNFILYMYKIITNSYKNKRNTTLWSWSLTKRSDYPWIIECMFIRSTRLPRDYSFLCINPLFLVDPHYLLIDLSIQSLSLSLSLSVYLSFSCQYYCHACLVVRLYVTPFRTPSIGIQFMDISNSNR